MSKLVEAAAEFLSRDTSTKQTKQITENTEDPSVTKKVSQKDQDAFHIHTTGTEHIYGGGDPDRETHSYHVHNTATGKTHSFQLEHGGEVVSRSQIRKMAPKEVSDKAVAAIHKDHKEEMQFSGE